MLARAQTRRWDEALSRVRFEQERVLDEIVRRSQSTAFGRAHDFAGIRTYRDYAERVSVGDYDTFSPFIERMRKGEKNLLVPEFIRYFGNSSGSSNQGKPKFLPISETQVGLQRKAGTDGLFRTLVKLDDDEFPTGFTARPLPADHDAAGRPRPHHVEPGAHGLANAARLQAVVLARRRDQGDGGLRREARAHRREATSTTTCARSPGRRAGSRCSSRSSSPKRSAAGARRARSRESGRTSRYLLGGGVSADPYMPVLREMMGRDDVFARRHVQRDRRRHLRVAATTPASPAC